MCKKWRINGNRIIFNHMGVDFFWEMPSGYKLPSESVLSLAEHILLKPFGIKIEVIKNKNKPKGNNIALAFSGGVDSAAAYNLLEKPIAIYSQVESPSKLHNIENALLALSEVNGISVLTNQDKLGLLYNKKRGFYGLAGWTIPSILLSEHFEITTFADGNILEFVYLRSKYGHGTLFNKTDYSSILKEFNNIGYHYCMPCAGMTEVITTRIANNFEYAMGCMRGSGGKPCLKCMKCYRKMALQGMPIDINPEAEKVLEKEWIPVLASLLWARDKYGLSHARINKISKEYDWVDKWFPDAIEYIPEHLRSSFITMLDYYKIEHITDKEKLYNWSSHAE